MTDVSNIKISEKQQQFLTATTPGVIYRGGIGSGKTRVMCYKAIIGALQQRKSAIVSHSYPMLRDVVMVTLDEVLPLFGLLEGVHYTKNKAEMSYEINGVRILLRSGDRPGSLRGLNLHDFYIDEAREFDDDEIFKIMLGRIRECEDARWSIVSSPNGKDWVYQLSTTPGVTLIVQSTEENPFLPRSYIEQLRLRYTSTFAAQELNADIIDLSGGVFQEHWFRVIPYASCTAPAVRFWDLAVSTAEKADYSAGVLMSRKDHKDIVHDVKKKKQEWPDLRKTIIAAAKDDGPHVHIVLEDAGQQRGFFDDLKRAPELRGHVVKAQKPHGNKVTRAEVWAARAEAGMLYICEGAYVKDYIEECVSFTRDDSHAHDDQVDGTSGAYQYLHGTASVRGARMRV